MKLFSFKDALPLENFKSFMHKEEPLITIRALEDRVVFSSSDNNKGIEKEVKNVNIYNQSDKISVDGYSFLKILNTLKNNEVTVEIKDEHLIIKSGKSRFKVAIIKNSLYSNFVKIKDGIILNKSITDDILAGFVKVLPAIERNNPLVALTGVLVNVDNKTLDVVGTDTKRLSLLRKEDVDIDNFKFDIPLDVAKNILKIADKIMRIKVDANYLFFYGEDFTIFTLLIDAKQYPSYQPIIDNTNMNVKEKVSINVQKLKDALKTIKIISDNNAVFVSIDNNLIYLKSVNQNLINEGETSIEDENIKVDQKIDFHININFLLDAINVADTENIMILFNDQENPIIFKDENFYQTIVMPLKI